MPGCVLPLENRSARYAASSALNSGRTMAPPEREAQGRRRAEDAASQEPKSTELSVVQLAWRSVPSVRWGRAAGMLPRNPGE
jgi:hypothetical protein